MEESPQAKGVKSVSGIIMLNFLYWLQTQHPAVKNLQMLPQTELLQLVREFERSRPDIERGSAGEWAEGINRLHAKAPAADYAEARAFYQRMQ
jgi:hypothetical protein